MLSKTQIIDLKALDTCDYYSKLCTYLKKNKKTLGKSQLPLQFKVVLCYKKFNRISLAGADFNTSCYSESC